MFQKTLVGAILVSSLLPVMAGTLYDEGHLGDLSNDPAHPTKLAPFVNGSNLLTGGTTWENAMEFDRDFWTITVPAGSELWKIVLEAYAGPQGSGSFFAVAVGEESGSIAVGEKLLAGNLVGKGNAGAGNDVLPVLGQASWAGLGFKGALPSGTYTFWFQESRGGMDTRYSMDFMVRALAVPEPSTWGLFLVGAAGLLSLAGRGSRHLAGTARPRALL